MDWKKIIDEFKPGEVVTITFKKADGSVYFQSCGSLLKITPEGEEPIELVKNDWRLGFNKRSLAEVERLGGSIELNHGDVTEIHPTPIIMLFTIMGIVSMLVISK